MEKFTITEEWLYQQMPRVDKVLLDEVTEEGAEDYQFSKRFERKMDKLLKQERRAAFYGRHQSLGKKIAAIFLVMLLLSSVAVISVEGFRKKFFNVVETMFDEFKLFEYTDTSELEEFQVIVPKYIPDGYKMIQQRNSTNKFITNYENESGHYFTLYQTKVIAKEDTVDFEYDEANEIKVNGEEAELQIKNDQYNCLVWYIGDIQYVIFSDTLSGEELTKIASTVIE